MFNKDKRSFFERITGSISVSDEDEVELKPLEKAFSPKIKTNGNTKEWLAEAEPVMEEVGDKMAAQV